MKLLTLSILFSMPLVTCNNRIQPNIVTAEPSEEVPIEFLIDAMIYVESKNNPNAIGDGGRAVGVLQIWPIMVRDVNRILRRRGISHRYTYEDRYDRDKSIEMFHIWKSHYHPHSSYEKIARCWNGGPFGHRRSSTNYYWYKVNYRMELLIWTE